MGDNVLGQTMMNRAVYYLSDIPLLCRSLFTYVRAHCFTADNKLIPLANPQQRKRARDKDKIMRYVGLCFFIGAHLGARNTCLIHSVVLCRMLKQHGLNATLTFGARKEDCGMIGHCWVTLDEAELPGDWQVILTCS